MRRVNQSRTHCADGASKPECYVATIDWNGQPEVEPRKALLRGNIVAKAVERFGKVGSFQVSESWQGAIEAGVSALSGTFYRVKDRGVRCITHPCATHHEAELNSIVHRNIAGVDLKSAGAGDELIATASAAMTEPGGVLVLGSNVPVRGPAGRAFTLKAKQFYLRGKGDRADKPCIRSGCSNQVCAEQSVVTTCEWRSEYACYAAAKCERQTDGSCGFTKTEQLKSCLARISISFTPRL